MSTGDFTSAKEFFEQYSVVDEKFYLIREFIIENTLPLRRTIQHNLVMSSGSVLLRKYPHTLEGIIESFVER